MQRHRTALVGRFGLGLLALALPAFSCNPSSLGGDDGLQDMTGSNCVNLQCRIVNCQAQGKPSTTLTGVVNIPAGNLPLYNATVYVPNSDTGDIVSGATCDRCSDVYSGQPIATTTTDANGRFTLKDVPVGENIPLVIRLGKWRRQITINNVASCSENPVTAEMTRLPRNKTEGDIPKIALSTGGYDAFECLLRKLGIDDSEFTPEGGSGRINLFAGHGGTNSYCKQGTGSCTTTLNGGANFTGSSTWWSSLDNLKKYDTVLLSCEGGQYATEKSDDAHRALVQYINMGGRVFASHWHNIWMTGTASDPINTIASFSTVAAGIEYNNPITASIYTSTDKGGALADWLVNTGGSTNRGALQILKARKTVTSILKPDQTERFVYYDDSTNGRAEQYFSFFAPLNQPKESQCGRMVFTDMHESGNDQMNPDPSLDQSLPTLPFPSGCITKTLSPQEKALVFLLFDLTNCLQPVIG